MQRRSMLKLGALTVGAATVKASGSERLLVPSLEIADRSEVKRVLVVSKCHLDVGFTATQEKVLRKYFDVYYPQAIATGAALRTAGPDRYTWTTGSFLLYEYLEQASPAQRGAMEQAIAAGDITWHALPFSWQTEMLDPSMIEGALSLSAVLDRRFGHKTVGAKMSDVPGHSRGIISPLAAAGVRLLDIGVNAASTPPETPPVFLWRDTKGASVVMVYHHHDYGGVVPIPGTTTVFAMEMANDNAGPHSAEQIAATYARLRARFPNAQVQASNLSEVALATDAVRDRLPVMTQEIGDTWIYGIPSDPPKVTQYREVARLRREWLQERKFAVGDETDRQLLRRLLLAVEHTWGTDTKSYLDHDHYTPADLKQALADPVKFPGYKTMTTSWREKRDDVDESVASLSPELRGRLKARLMELSANKPSHEGLKPHTGGSAIETRFYTMAVNPENGSLVRLKNKRTGKEWASAERPMALFTYQTLSAQDFAQFLDTYVKSKADWAPQDFGKPNIDHFGALSREWHPRLTNVWTGTFDKGQRVMLELEIADAAAAATGLVAWPASIYLEMTMPDAEPRIDLRLYTLGKVENRLPEAMWLSFNPQTKGDADGWQFEKVGQPMKPSDVVRGGNRNMHAISEKIRYSEEQDMFEIVTLDAPVVALGRRSPLNFSLDAPDLRSGVHVNLYNNAWGTNYPQWCGGDWSYRFSLRG